MKRSPPGLILEYWHRCILLETIETNHVPAKDSFVELKVNGVYKLYQISEITYRYKSKVIYYDNIYADFDKAYVKMSLYYVADVEN